MPSAEVDVSTKASFAAVGGAGAAGGVTGVASLAPLASMCGEHRLVGGSTTKAAVVCPSAVLAASAIGVADTSCPLPAEVDLGSTPKITGPHSLSVVKQGEVVRAHHPEP